MPCKHLHELIEMCERNNLKLSSSDLIRMVCPSCGVEEECPSTLCDEYDAPRTNRRRNRRICRPSGRRGS
jgi:hypothetical protein